MLRLRFARHFPRENAPCAYRDHALLGVMLALAACEGCNNGRPITYPASGTVKFQNGQPVRFGVVEFRAKTKGVIARAKIDQSGRFRLGTFSSADGAVAGSHQVIVAQPLGPDVRPAAEADEHGGHEHEHGGESGLVDPRYADYQTSPLTAQIKDSGENSVQLVVESWTPVRPSSKEPRHKR